MLVSGKANNFFEFGPGQNAVLEKMRQLGSRKEVLQLMVTVLSSAMRAVLDHAAGPAVLMISRSRNQGKGRHMRIVSDCRGAREKWRRVYYGPQSSLSPWKISFVTVCLCLLSCSLHLWSKREVFYGIQMLACWLNCFQSVSSKWQNLAFSCNILKSEQNANVGLVEITPILI